MLKATALGLEKVLDRVKVSRIFWDSNLFIYLVEDQAEHAEQVAALRKRMIERDDELLTSALTLGEVLVKPMETGDTT